MSQILNNSATYSMITEKDLAIILSKFDSQYIFDIMQDHLKNKFSTNFILAKPNAVESYEQTFKNLASTFSMDTDNISETRDATYKSIINIILKEYKFNLMEDDDLNYYTLAYYMYDLFVANFSNYISVFFANYIALEKNNIYTYFRLEELKKNKDSSTIYGKKTYKDPKLAIINANLVYILDSMEAFDITFKNFLTLTYKDSTIAQYLLKYISPIEDFYKTYVYDVFRNLEIRPLYITYIRLEIQKMQSLEE